MKKITTVVAVSGVLMMLTGGVMSFVSSFAKDVSDTKQNAEIIETQYDGLKKVMEEFNQVRENIYSNVINDLYTEHVVEKYHTWIGEFQKYEQIVESILSYRSMLKERCLSILYNDSNIQSQCDSMVLSYENAMNYYVKDVHKLNTFIELYNASVDELSKVAFYDLKTYNYIDFNDDGKYLGK